MRRRVVLSAWLAGLTLLAPIPGSAAGGPARPALLEYRARGARSALVVLHGLYLSPAAIERATGLTALARRNRFDVVYPAGVRLSWNAGWCCGTARSAGIDDVGYLRGVVTQLRQRGIRRVVLAGFSNGGMMAYRYACALGRRSRVDAVLVVGGTYESDAPCRYAGPVVHVHGLADPTVPFRGTRWSEFLAAPLRDVRTIDALARLTAVSVRPLRGVGHVWPVATANAILVRELGLEAPWPWRWIQLAG